MRLSEPLPVAVESDNFALLIQCLVHEPALVFQVPLGMPDWDILERMHRCDVDPRDLAPGRLVVGHLRGRTLPVAAARFMDQMVNALVHCNAQSIQTAQSQGVSR